MREHYQWHPSNHSLTSGRPRPSWMPLDRFFVHRLLGLEERARHLQSWLAALPTFLLLATRVLLSRCLDQGTALDCSILHFRSWRLQAYERTQNGDRIVINSSACSHPPSDVRLYPWLSPTKCSRLPHATPTQNLSGNRKRAPWLQCTSVVYR